MIEHSKKKARIDYIDLFRALGIIFMIMGHIKFGGYFDKWIHAFHMPMFFFISGYFFYHRDNVNSQIKKKVRSLLLPYVFFEVFQWLILMIFISEYRTFKTLIFIFFENTYKITIENGTFGISPIPGAMWFLTAIFFTEVIYIILDKFFGCNWKLHISVGIIMLAGMILPTVFHIRLPWALDTSFVGIGFYHLARMVHRSESDQKMRMKLIPTILLGILDSFLILLSPKVNMRTGNYGWFIPFWINACGSILVGMNISRYGERFLKRKKTLNIMLNWLEGIGRNSIIYLCLNQVIILGVTKAVYMIGINGFVAKVIVLIFTLGFLFMLEKIICGTQLSKVIGR